MGLDAPSHWLIVIGLAIVIFGYKKLPDAARSVGRSLRIFKTEIKGMNEDDKARDAAAPAVAADSATPTVEPVTAPAQAPVASPEPAAVPPAPSLPVAPAEASTPPAE